MLIQALTILEVVSAALALALVYLFLKMYSVKRIPSLLGLPFGFLLLAVSYLFFAAAFFAYNLNTFSTFMWLRLVSQNWGFALIAFSYFLSKQTIKTTKYYLFSIASWSIVLLLCVLGFLVTLFPVSLSSVYSANDYFTIVNLALLTYIVLFLIRRLEMAKTSVLEPITAPIAFALLWLGQFSFMIWNFEGSVIALVTSHVVRVIGLLLFIRLYYLAHKRLV